MEKKITIETTNAFLGLHNCDQRIYLNMMLVGGRCENLSDAENLLCMHRESILDCFSRIEQAGLGRKTQTGTGKGTRIALEVFGKLS